MSSEIDRIIPGECDAETPANIRILVVDDHPSMRMGIISLVDSQPFMEVVAEASDGEEAIEVYDDVRPDVVLMDLRMHNMGGAEAILSICRKDPHAKIIVLSTYDWDEDIHRALQSGAKSYLLKDMAVEEIAGTIRGVFDGNEILPSQIADRLAQRAERQPLTERERDVLECLIKGRSNKEIAQSLYVSDETVKSHLKTLFAKLGVRDRTEAAITAIRHGIVHLD